MKKCDQPTNAHAHGCVNDPDAIARETQRMNAALDEEEAQGRRAQFRVVR